MVVPEGVRQIQKGRRDILPKLLIHLSHENLDKSSSLTISPTNMTLFDAAVSKTANPLLHWIIPVAIAS